MEGNTNITISQVNGCSFAHVVNIDFGPVIVVALFVVNLPIAYTLYEKI